MVLKKIMFLCGVCAVLISGSLIATESRTKTDSTLKKVVMVGAGASSICFGIYWTACSVQDFFDNGLFFKNVGTLVGAIGAIACGAKVVRPLVKEAQTLFRYIQTLNRSGARCDFFT